MSFWQVDDKAFTNHKTRALMDLSVTGEANGAGALGLWTMAGSFSQGSGTDGAITLLSALRLMPDRALVLELAGLLVRVGLWHGEGHACLKCPPITEGGWRFHDWFQYGYDTAAGKRLADAKAKELQSPKIRNAVWARDCNDGGLGRQGPCAYCGKTLRLGNKNGPTEDRPTMDHLDPLLAVGPRNIVLACGGCNKQKAQRTPDQAGMTLRFAPHLISSPDPLDEAPAPAAAAPSRSAADEPSASTQERATTADRAAAPPTQGYPQGHPPADPSPDPEGSDQCGGVLAGARGVGSGSGLGLVGSGEGEAGSADPPPARRRRRRGGRGRGRAPAPPAPAPAADPPPPAGPAALRWDAGQPPELLEPGRFGSPWHHHTGPPIHDRENYCPDHDVPLPCRRCTQEPR